MQSKRERKKNDWQSNNLHSKLKLERKKLRGRDSPELRP